MSEKINIDIFHYERGNQVHQEVFASLNLEWIEKFFKVEDIDKKVLSNPEEQILDAGGYIIFAGINDIIAGTVALNKMGENTYEMHKLAVSSQHQGQGIGLKLIESIIQLCKEIKAEKLYLISNKKLHSALNLYNKLGFIDSNIHLNSKYERGDMSMELSFIQE